jgi:catechol 2,3-dioxygenase-like lactoylglutathione lyase family enzyme
MARRPTQGLLRGSAAGSPTATEPGSASGATIDELVVAADPAAWGAAGFRVEDGVVEAASVRVRLAGSDAGRGLISWSLRGIESTDLDGLPTEVSERPPASGAPHPNGVVAVDHVVVFSPDLDRSVESLREAGLNLRRVREEPTPAGAPRQAFFRLGQVILEVIQVPDGSPLLADPDSPARLWGISFLAADLDQGADVLGEPRDAVQPGRLIATVRREANLGLPVALMTPGPGAA